MRARTAAISIVVYIQVSIEPTNDGRTTRGGHQQRAATHVLYPLALPWPRTAPWHLHLSPASAASYYGRDAGRDGATADGGRGNAVRGRIYGRSWASHVPFCGRGPADPADGISGSHQSNRPPARLTHGNVRGLEPGA